MGVILPSTTGALISSAVGMAMSLIPYKKNLFDLSTHRTEVVVEGEFGGESILIPLVTQFADDRDAIEIQEIDANEVTTSYNGKLISVGKMPKYRVTISLIPHSPNDIEMSNLALACSYQRTTVGGLNAKAKGKVTLTVKQDRIDEQAASFQLLGVGKAKQIKAVTEFQFGTLVSSSAVANVKSDMKHGAETTASREGRQTASVYVFEFTQCATRVEAATESTLLGSLGVDFG